MTRLQRRTPCVGICSTTYGDLVCRGCKRFAHEIFDWNRYSEEQRQDVVARLQQLKGGVVQRYLQLTDRPAWEALLAAQWRPGEDLLLAAYEYLTRQGAGSVTTQADLPFRYAQGVHSTAALRQQVEAEFLERSKATYERNFKVTVD